MALATVLSGDDRATCTAATFGQAGVSASGQVSVWLVKLLTPKATPPMANIVAIEANTILFDILVSFK